MMAHTQVADGPLAVVLRLQAATNEHDLDALVDCFATDYVSDIPVHPSRGFRGAGQVRDNWTQILAGVPDLRSELIRHAVQGDLVWAEWEWTGTRRDGVAHLMRGTTILRVEGQRIDWARFYMEPVVDDVVGIASSVAQSVAQRPVR